MKKLLLIIMIGFSGFAQCKIKSTYDKFDKTYKFESNSLGIYNGSTGFNVIFLKIQKDDLKKYFIYTGLNTKECLIGTSFLQFLTEDGKELKLNYKGDITCSPVFGFFEIDEQQLKELSESNITDVRLFYEYATDVSLNAKVKEKIKDGMKCILNGEAKL